MKKNNIPILVFLILLITSVIFLPSLNNNFTNWDDGQYITQNKITQNLSWKNIKTIFISFHALNYHPLALLSYSLEYHFFRLDPRVYHTTNLAFHLLNCLFVFWIIFIIKADPLVCFTTALFFGIHPFQTESVVWISGRRDVLYSFFFLSAIICYLYYIKKESWGYYYCSIILFILSLLTKAITITLPFLLFLFDWRFGRKLCKNNLKDKIPFLTIAILFAFVTFLIRNSSGDIVRAHLFGLHYNLAIPSFALLFYLSKMIIPIKLSCIYPYNYKILTLGNSLFFFSPFILAILITILLFLSNYTKKIIFGTLFFLINISLVLQIIPSCTAFSIVADRYFYIPSIGLFYLIGEFFFWIYSRYGYTKKIKLFFWLCLTGLIIGLSFLTWQRSKVWKNSLTLWNDVITKYSQGYIPFAYFNRSTIYIEQKKYKQAFSDLDKALMLYNNVLLKRQRNYSQIYSGLLLNAQGDADTYNFFGMEFANVDRNAEAFILFTLAIQTNPYYLQSYINLTVIYVRLKLYKQAIECGEITLKLAPDNPNIHYNLSVAYYLDKQYDLAVKHLETASKLGFTPQPEFLKEIEKQKKRSGTKN